MAECTEADDEFTYGRGSVACGYVEGERNEAKEEMASSSHQQEACRARSINNNNNLFAQIIVQVFLFSGKNTKSKPYLSNLYNELRVIDYI